MSLPKSFLIAGSIHCFSFFIFHLIFSLQSEKNVATSLLDYQIDLYSVSRAKKKSTQKPKKKVVQKKTKVRKKQIISKKLGVQKKVVKQNQQRKPTNDRVVPESKLDNPNVIPFGNKRPIYPKVARDRGIEGFVKFKLLVDQAGKVVSLKC